MCIYIVLLVFFLNMTQIYMVDTVSAGQELTFSVPVTLPDDAQIPFQQQMDMNRFSAPLPFPFRLENATYHDGIVHVKGRCVFPGTYEIPLGVVSYGGQSIVLPATRIFVKIPPEIILDSNDFLYPYPAFLLQIQKTNRLMVEKQIQHAFFQTQRHVKQVQKVFKGFFYSSIAAGFILGCYFLYTVTFLKSTRIKMQSSVTYKDYFINLRRLHILREDSWGMLVQLLNKYLSDKSGQEECGRTAQELQIEFAQLGEKDLSAISASIVAHGYTKQQKEQYDPVYRAVVDIMEKK